MAPQSPVDRTSSLWIAGRRVLLATVVLLVCLGLVLNDLANSNRPHELTAAPWVTLLAAANLWLGLRASRALKVHGQGHPELALGWRALALTALLGVVMLVDVFVLLGAAGTVPAVLGWSEGG